MPHETHSDEGPTQGTHTGDQHRGDPHRGPAQGTLTGDPHRGKGPTEDPPLEGRATQETHTEHTQTFLSQTGRDWHTHKESMFSRSPAASPYVLWSV